MWPLQSFAHQGRIEREAVQGLWRKERSVPRREVQRHRDVNASAASEALSYAEKEIEARGAIDMRGHRRGVRVVRIRDIDRIKRRIEVHREVKPDWSNRRVVAKAKTDGMGEIVEAAGTVGHHRRSWRHWQQRSAC